MHTNIGRAIKGRDKSNKTKPGILLETLKSTERFEITYDTYKRWH